MTRAAIVDWTLAASIVAALLIRSVSGIGPGADLALVLWAVAGMCVVGLPTLLGLLILLFPLSLTAIVQPIGTVGPVNVQVVDALIIVLAARLFVTKTATRKAIVIPVLLPWVLAYLLVTAASMLVMSMSASGGSGVARPELVAFARFASQVLMYAVVANVIIDFGCENAVSAAVFAFGCIYCGSVWIHRALLMKGILIGAWAGTPAAGRVSGLLGDTSRTALISLFFVFLVASGYYPSWRIRRTVAQAAWLIFFIGALLMTGTRGALTGIAVGWLVFEFLRWRRGTSAARIVLENGALLAVAVVCVAAVPGLLGVGIARATHGPVLAILESRAMPMLDALRIVAGRPWLGVGYGGGQFFESRRLFSAYLPGQVWPPGSYNVFLEAALNGGVLGLVAFAAFAVVAVRLGYALQAARTPSKSQAAFARAVFIFVAMMFVGIQTENWLSPGEPTAYFVWILIGAAEGAAYLASMRPADVQSYAH